MFGLSDLVSDSEGGSSSGGFFQSLSDLATGAVSSIGGAAIDRATNSVAPRTQNAAPVPDIAAKAATPGGSFISGGGAIGLSLPVILVGLGVLIVVLVRRR